jgi:hypothetical protein
MTIRKNILITATITIFLGVIFLGLGLGFWNLIGEDSVTGESLIMEISNKYNIPLETIYSTWDIPEEVSPRTPLEEVKELTGLSMGKFKVWVSTYAAGEPTDPIPSEIDHEEIDYPDAIEEIKGSTTLKDLSSTFNIPLEEIYSNFDLPQTLGENTQLKTLRDEYDVKISVIKEWISSQ